MKWFDDPMAYDAFVHNVFTRTGRWFFGLIALIPLAVGTMFVSSYVFVQSQLLAVVVVLLFPFTFAVAFARRRKLLSMGSAVLPWIGLITAMTISSVAGVSVWKSLQGTWERWGSVGDWLLLLVFYMTLLVLFSSAAHWRHYWRAVVIVATVTSGIGLAQVTNMPWVYASGERAFSTLGNPAFFASYLLLTLVGTFFLIRTEKARALQYAGVFSAAVQCIAIIVSGTRAAYVALLVMFFVALVEQLRYRYVNRGIKKDIPILRRLIQLFLLAILVLVAIIIVVRPQVMHETFARVTQTVSLDQTTRDRLVVWDSAARGFFERPVLGWGEQNFIVVFQRYYNPALYRGEGQSLWYDRAHSEFFERLVAGGVLGVIAYLIWFVVPIILLYRLTKVDRRFLPLMAGCIGYACYLLFYFHSIADMMLFTSLYAFSVYSYFAERKAGMAFTRHVSNDKGGAKTVMAGLVGASVGIVVLISIYLPRISENYRVKQFITLPESPAAYAAVLERDLGISAARALVDGMPTSANAGTTEESAEMVRLTCRLLRELSRSYPHEVRWWIMQARAAEVCAGDSAAIDIARASLTAAMQLAPLHPHVYHSAGLIFFNRSIHANSIEERDKYADDAHRAFLRASSLAPGVPENELMVLASQTLISPDSPTLLATFIHEHAQRFDPYTQSLVRQLVELFGSSNLENN